MFINIKAYPLYVEFIWGKIRQRIGLAQEVVYL